MLGKSFITAKNAKPSFAIASEGKKAQSTQSKTLDFFPLRSLRNTFATFAVNYF